MARSRSATNSPTAAATGVLDRLGLWPLRVLWFAVPLIIGPGLAGGLDRFEDPGPVIAEVCLWAGWFLGLVAVLAPSTISLTISRVLSPGLVGLALLAGLATGEWPGSRLAALAYGTFVTAVCYLPVVGDRMVNGSAYGSERRMTLRPPAFALLGPIQLAWAIVFAGAVSGPFLLASGRYVSGVVAVLLGGLAIWLGTRVLHQLARRWLVFVPAGFVIHDHVVAIESILFRRTTIASLGPATVRPDPDPDQAAAAGPSVDTVDLTGGAAGLALEVEAEEPVTFARRIGRDVATTEASRIIFTPTLPGAVLTEARVRAIPIG